MQTEAPYILVSRLGEGGMAEVYKAIKIGPEGWEKPVALKRILPQFADRPEFLRLLKDEARLHAQLSHPNIVQILDFFRHERSFLIALEYVHGRNLRTVFADARDRGLPLPWQASVFIVSEVLKALDYAHKSQGDSGPLHLVHRDVSPQNVLISYAGLVKLSDFGIARADVAREETGSGVLRGKCRYLAPEQLQKGTIDFRVDLFAAGVLLYELITGKHPFAAENEFELLKRIERAEFEPSAALNPDVPASVHEAIARALRLNPAERQEDAALFRRELLIALDPAWLSGGSDLLGTWMGALYPDPAERQEPPIEKTPLITQHGTPLPSEVVPTESLMFGAARSEPSPSVLRRFSTHTLLLWGIAALVLLGGSARLLFFKSPAVLQNPSAQPIPTVAVSPTPAVLSIYGTLDLHASKRSRVFLNGRSLGTVPLTEAQIHLAPGNYLISVKPPKKRSTHKKIHIDAGRTLSLYAPFKEKK